MKHLILSVFLFMASIAQATSYFPSSVTKAPEGTGPDAESMRLHEFAVKEGAEAIPRSWRLVSVSACGNSSDVNLWFQAEDGSVYILQGNTSQDGVKLNARGFKIPAK